MAELYSSYTSGAEFPAGTLGLNSTGVSGLNPIVDRLNSISNDDGVYSNLTGGTGISINNGSVITNTQEQLVLVPGEGIDIINGSQISAENATTTNKGISSFNSSNFSVSDGAVSLLSGTQFWNIPGVCFIPVPAQSANLSITLFGGIVSNRIMSNANNQYLVAPVNLPHGAEITSAEVDGSSSNHWYLVDAGTAIGSGTFNTADTISYIVDNVGTDHIYFSVELDTNERIDYAQVNYRYAPSVIL